MALLGKYDDNFEQRLLKLVVKGHGGKYVLSKGSTDKWVVIYYLHVQLIIS